MSQKVKTMFLWRFLEGIHREFESLRKYGPLIKYGQNRALDENNCDLINFESEKRNKRNAEKLVFDFFANDGACFNGNKKGHIGKICRSQQQKITTKKSKLEIKHFKCKISHFDKKCFNCERSESHLM